MSTPVESSIAISAYNTTSSPLCLADAMAVEATALSERRLNALPVAVAAPVTSAMSTAAAAPAQQPLVIQAPLNGQQPARKRAQYTSVTVYKPDAQTRLGITVQQWIGQGSDGGLFVSNLKPHGILRQSPIQVGDILMSINGRCCEAGLISCAQAGKILRESVGIVTLVVCHPAGDPHLVETMCQRLTNAEPWGISLQHTRQGKLKVSRVNPSGVFAHSLVNTGDVVLSMNGIDCVGLDSKAAVGILKRIPDQVTLVTKTLRTTGVVVADNPSTATGTATRSPTAVRVRTATSR